MKVYTKTGDTGLTSLIGGTRVFKSSHRIDAYGTVDELNSWIGLVRDQDVNAARRGLLKEVQDRLFTLGATLATDPAAALRKALPAMIAADVTLLEDAIDAMDVTLPPLREFVLPGGHPAVSYCHLARTVCRRAERLVIALHADAPVEELIITYLNRLSDYLFVLSRAMAQELGAEQVVWKPRLAPPAA